MKLVIIESKGDIFCVQKKYPYPLELLLDKENFIRVKDYNGEEFNIYKNKIKKYDIVKIKDKDFKKF